MNSVEDLREAFIVLIQQSQAVQYPRTSLILRNNGDYTGISLQFGSRVRPETQEVICASPLEPARPLPVEAAVDWFMTSVFGRLPAPDANLIMEIPYHQDGKSWIGRYERDTPASPWRKTADFETGVNPLQIPTLKPEDQRTSEGIPTAANQAAHPAPQESSVPIVPDGPGPAVDAGHVRGFERPSS